LGKDYILGQECYPEIQNMLIQDHVLFDKITVTMNDMHSKGRRLNLHFRIVIKTQGPLFKPLLHFYRAVSQQQEIVVKRASGNEAGHKLGFTRFYMFYKSFPVCVAMLRCLCVLQVRGVCRMCWSGLVCTISDTSDYVGSHLILFLNY